MNKHEVSSILFEIGTLLALQGEGFHRVNAYQNASRVIAQLDKNLDDVIKNDELKDLKGIGSTLQEKITTLFTTGKLDYYENLKAKTPSGLLEMLRVDGFGPKKVRAVYEELGVDSLEKLKLV